ncbi:alpha amylase [Rhodococcus triatomae BKS 15-14]|nr:alpha amylase [Rhodococcus triatomae BKS 15-14]
MVATLLSIADQCDGVLCDMATLAMTDVFSRTWGSRVADPPAGEYWREVIGAVRAAHPGFVFVAEAYWDLEWDLQQQGFDFCYDKRLYDRLVGGDAAGVRAHLGGDPAYQRGLMRFVENHDEPRAAAAFAGGREKVAIVTAFTQAGARLVHHGQAEGRVTRLPVFLGRRPVEEPDSDLRAFHAALWSVLSDSTFRYGTHQPCELFGWSGNDTVANLVAWCWDGDSRWLIVVNLSDGTARSHARAPWPDLQGRAFRLVDPTTGSSASGVRTRTVAASHLTGVRAGGVRGSTAARRARDARTAVDDATDRGCRTRTRRPPAPRGSPSSRPVGRWAGRCRRATAHAPSARPRRRVGDSAGRPPSWPERRAAARRRADPTPRHR